MTTLAWHSTDPAVHAVHDVERGVYLMVDCPAPGDDEPRHIFSVRDGDGAHSPAIVIGSVHERDIETAKRVAEAVAAVVAQGGNDGE